VRHPDDERYPDDAPVKAERRTLGQRVVELEKRLAELASMVGEHGERHDRTAQQLEHLNREIQA